MALRKRFAEDFFLFAEHCLKIRTKAGAIRPFVPNEAQRHLHSQLEGQLQRTGKVRALVLKGRQQGVSTYAEARFYWRVTHRRGVRAFILTHENEATNNLFDMVARFHECNLEVMRPSADASNARELIFGKLDSGYKVGTAGNKGVGRSSTIQFSMVPRWHSGRTRMSTQRGSCRLSLTSLGQRLSLSRRQTG
ncbi:hypothetical protein VSS37_03825 [Candidatus Thiothrix sp. Deng01]|uniref:Resolvase/invertase-type recombinase catalytic domain-containing protein n=1 Tax=Candidatus Thiothrix phosphatis TaxID=3112415 RepID=A0ABU6CTF2_9GAMM|nr:hypothetical protein [Candidatus Thiothrix sp. Deng01]MEB4590100.1 hypothetical protein [Candidatus Thiothrix sp. Deng01]